jgi:hypothetical protein
MRDSRAVPISVVMVELVLPPYLFERAAAMRMEQALGNFSAPAYGEALLLRDGVPYRGTDPFTLSFEPQRTLVTVRIGDPREGELALVQRIRFATTEELADLQRKAGRRAIHRDETVTDLTPEMRTFLGLSTFKVLPASPAKASFKMRARALLARLRGNRGV